MIKNGTIWARVEFFILFFVQKLEFWTQFNQVLRRNCRGIEMFCQKFDIGQKLYFLKLEFLAKTIFLSKIGIWSKSIFF